jgi:hypothetical protein
LPTAFKVILNTRWRNPARFHNDGRPPSKTP